jgi:hypothetical protein
MHGMHAVQKCVAYATKPTLPDIQHERALAFCPKNEVDFDAQDNMAPNQ